MNLNQAFITDEVERILDGHWDVEDIRVSDAEKDYIVTNETKHSGTAIC
ncbi:hypothetical protein QFZ63_000087 [Streptomyces sp. B3I7]|nr:hypothetical protein [Streptomyces sp. B3I7]MDQ0808373.1 hypothetical protein [Streptomyces sp. B3I7]